MFVQKISCVYYQMSEKTFLDNKTFLAPKYLFVFREVFF